MAARVTVEEREAETICLSVTDEQAQTLRRMREWLGDDGVCFARQMRADGSRAVVTRAHVLIVNLDRDGYAVGIRDGRWQRLGLAYDPS